VKEKNSNTIIFSTGETKAEELRQQKTLWLFPNYELGIRLKGTTIDELAHSRTKRNLMLIVLMDVVLLAGAWFVYRSIRREMELVKAKSDFVSNVSHELRTPLALIRMFGETLEMGRVKSDEKKQEYYSTIVKESERLTRLINNILDFSKMEAGKKQYKFQDADINAIVSSVMHTYSFHLQNEGFTPIVELANNLPLISIDAEAVTEAVINLIDNAIKYSGDEKYLRVRTRQTDSAIAVEVEDHGVGIAEEHRKKIFDTFYRVGTALVHNTKGSGLGLSLVKHIMDAHGGRVEVESAVGKGSVFRLLFLSEGKR
jgi:two-component system phosphate regulon sensor histidine kinase PhoR